MKHLPAICLASLLFGSPAAAKDIKTPPEGTALCETHNAVLFEDFESKRSRAAKIINKEKNYRVGNGLMTVIYVSNEKGSERNRAHIPLSRDLRQATLNFDVYFPFRFGAGKRLNLMDGQVV